MQVVSHNIFNFGYIQTTTYENMTLVGVNDKVISIMSIQQSLTNPLNYYNDIVGILNDPDLKINIVKVNDE